MGSHIPQHFTHYMQPTFLKFLYNTGLMTAVMAETSSQ